MPLTADHVADVIERDLEGVPLNGHVTFTYTVKALRMIIEALRHRYVQPKTDPGPFDAEERERLRRLADLIEGADWIEVEKPPHDIDVAERVGRTIDGPDLRTIERALRWMGAEVTPPHRLFPERPADSPGFSNQEMRAGLQGLTAEYLARKHQKPAKPDCERIPLGEPVLGANGDYLYPGKIPSGAVFHGFDFDPDTGLVALVERKSDSVPSITVQCSDCGYYGKPADGRPSCPQCHPRDGAPMPAPGGLVDHAEYSAVVKVGTKRTRLFGLGGLMEGPSHMGVPIRTVNEPVGAWGWAPEWLRHLGAFFRLNKSLVCEFSNRGDGWDHHDYPDAGPNAAPMHFNEYNCARCGKEFTI